MIQVTRSVYEKLKDKFVFEARGDRGQGQRQRRSVAAEAVADGVDHEGRVASGIVGASARKLDRPPS